MLSPKVINLPWTWLQLVSCYRFHRRRFTVSLLGSLLTSGWLIAMKPEFTGPGGRDINLGGEKGSEIIQRLQAKIRPDMFPTPGGMFSHVTRHRARSLR